MRRPAPLLRQLLRIALAATPAVLLAGCLTTGETTLEENNAAYKEAKAFLHVGITTQPEVRAKYGPPQAVQPADGGGESWTYRRTDTVIVTAYTGTPMGTDQALLNGQPGFQRTIVRRTQMDVVFDTNGVLTDYRILRNAP